ncbi:MarR family transcriptional regulator [Vibrio sp. DW001]|uniref:MarR family winged helix-turn-helix transcriptional regulator n=1 Tax=Vibrio sp. DW001 TaxID=2912315 RepID=UPI0023B03878|nr:MarR family transcriptional regulator [Vibrio sp. DW001]WED29620.1 MarR family transcriptional regulator [Vibrio sp. DW001]
MSEDFLMVRNSSFGSLANLITFHMTQRMKEKLAEKELTIKLFGALMILMAEDEITQIEIAKRAGLPGYATSRTLDELEKLELIERTPNPSSRRSFLIVLTNKGRKLGSTLPAIVNEVNQDVLFPLSKEEQEQLIFNLQKIAKPLTS